MWHKNCWELDLFFDPLILASFKAKFVGGIAVKVAVFPITTVTIFFEVIKYQGNEKMGWLP
jgi:hypothetical protein